MVRFGERASILPSGGSPVSQRFHNFVLVFKLGEWMKKCGINTKYMCGRSKRSGAKALSTRTYVPTFLNYKGGYTSGDIYLLKRTGRQISAFVIIVMVFSPGDLCFFLLLRGNIFYLAGLVELIAVEGVLHFFQHRRKHPQHVPGDTGNREHLCIDALVRRVLSREMISYVHARERTGLHEAKSRQGLS